MSCVAWPSCSTCALHSFSAICTYLLQWHASYPSSWLREGPHGNPCAYTLSRVCDSDQFPFDAAVLSLIFIWARIHLTMRHEYLWLSLSVPLSCMQAADEVPNLASGETCRFVTDAWEPRLMPPQSCTAGFSCPQVATPLPHFTRMNRIPTQLATTIHTPSTHFCVGRRLKTTERSTSPQHTF